MQTDQRSNNRPAAARAHTRWTSIARTALIGIARTNWKVAPGITLGTPLAELERLNQKTITFSGFGFDGSGAIRFWNGGRLRAFDEAESPRVFFSLWQSPGTPDLEATRGDRLLTSDLPGLSTLRLFVGEITVSY